MGGSETLQLPLRRQRLEHRDGFAVWAPYTETVAWKAAETALVLCDVWNHHTCRGAEVRLERLIPRMAAVVQTLRRQGVLIVHAPSNTMDFYAGTPARERVLEAAPVAPPADLERDDPPLPIDAEDGGCDTLPDHEHPRYERGMPYPWTRQHAGIEIDQAQDVISDSGRDLYAVYQARGVRHVLIMGVHTNMCVLHRTFAIKQLVRWGVDVALLRDLTDTMYNPARPPYVGHEEGTRLVVGFIEKHWCGTVESDVLV
jgi:nicotinamidase-related amidase